MKIWFRLKHNGFWKKPECIDTCAKCDVEYIVSNYRLAFGVLKGQFLYKNAKVWAGLMRDEPPDQEV